MSEEKKPISNKDAKEEVELKKESTEKNAETKEDNTSVELDLSEPKENKKEEMVDDLPDDIKKKLEERKNKKAGKKQVKKRKKKEKRIVDVGKVYVKATYNNTIVTITDLNGNVISWASAGMAGFKGPKKATSYAAQIIARIAIQGAKEDFGLKEVSIFIKGVGTGREAAVRAVNANGLIVTSIKDITPVPHNGCRPKKPRRV